ADRIARWDGATWSPLAAQLGFYPTTLAVFDGELYAGGSSLLGVRQKFDGATWTVIGTGLDAGKSTAGISDIVINDAGHLFVGGSFTYAGTTFSPFIAQGNLLGTIPAPPLSIRLEGDNIVISWPLEAA